MSQENPIFPPSLMRALPYYILLLAVLLAYGNVYNNEFVYDDDLLIVGNTYLRSWSNAPHIFISFLTNGANQSGHFYRPMQDLCYLIIYQFFGLSLIAFHSFNIALHATNACLVYLFGRRMKFHSGATFLAALIWAVHPLQTEAVTYMSSTADTLHVTFCLLSLLMLPQQMLAACGFFILALLSKEGAVVVPLLAASCIYYQKPTSWRAYLRLWPLILITLLYLVMRFTLLNPNSTQLLNMHDPNVMLFKDNIFCRLYTFMSTVPEYLRLIVWPTGLHMGRLSMIYIDIHHPEVILGMAATAIVILIAAITRSTTYRPLNWGIVWAACGLIPYSNILIPANAMFMEHWLYLPLVGLFLGTAQTLHNISQNPTLRRTETIAALTATLILMTLTHSQNKIWHDPITFFSNMVTNGETSDRTYSNLGVAYYKKGNYDEALRLLHEATVKADTFPDIHENIAGILARAPGGSLHREEQIAELQRALAIDPDYLPAAESLVIIYDEIGDKAASTEYQKRVDAIKLRKATQNEFVP